LLFLRQAARAGFLCLLLITISVIALAQASGPQTTTVNEQSIVRLENTRHPLAIEANAVGRVEAGRQLQRMLLQLSLSPVQEEQLKNLLDDQQNRKSANYHHWLSSAELGAQFGAADADVQRVLDWLQGAGFTVARVAGSKRWLEFSGTVSQVENTFHTVMKYYRVNGKTYVANSTDLAVPAELSGITRGVVSLNNFGKRPPVHEVHGTAGRDAQGVRTKLTANLTATGATNTYYVAPGDFAAIYNTKGLLSSGIDGTGVSIAVTAQSQIELTDVQQFRQIFGLKANDPNFLLSGPDPGVASETDSEEALLDVEWAGAVAPGATINLVVAGSTDTTSGVDLAAAYAIDNEVSPILTYTYGSCEQALGSTGNAFYNALWQQAAAEGITVLVASGDNGAAGCDSATAGLPAVNGLAVNGVASTPYNVAVGGTQFAEGTQATAYWSATNAADYSSAIGYIPEAAWNESCDPSQPASSTNCILGNGNFSMLASGGGASTVYSKPSWQAGTGVPADGARDLPDVSLAAAAGHDEAVYCTSLGGTPCQINAQQAVVGLTLVGGTSVSTPAMAGILALIEQKNGTLQGQVNYALYRLAQVQGNSCNSSNQTNPTTQNSCMFYDVTSGNNSVPCAGGSPGCSSTVTGTNGLLAGQQAGPGYDLVTGLGSVNATNLSAQWTSLNLSASQTILQTSSASFVHGTPVTLNGNVAPTTGTGSPAGVVAIKTDLYGDSQQTLALTSGSFSGAVSDLPGGQYNLHAYYAGDAAFASSESGGVALNVTPENSTTTITVNGLQSGTAGYGAPLQLKVMTAGASGQGIATGTVTIQDGTNLVCTSNLAADGTAYLLTGGGAGYAFAPGPHSVTAAYSGDNSFTASTSPAAAFTIAKGTPFVVVGANTATLTIGQTLGVHAVVASQGTAPATGTVQFIVDGSTFGAAVALQTGGFFGTQAQASTLIPNLSQGTHTIGASYNGTADPNYASVVSGDPVNELMATVTVGTAAGNKTTTSLVMNTAPTNMGDTGVFTVTVSPTTATGTVTLWDAVGPRTAATPIGAGTATVQFAWPQAGSTSVYAVYSGDSANAGSASVPVSFTVQKGLPQMTLTAPASVSSDGQVSLNASVIGNPANPQIPYPVGVVELWDSLNGGAAQLLTAQTLTSGPGGSSVSGIRLKLASGTHSLFAHYRGDTNWQAANSASVSLVAATFAVSISPTLIGLAAGNAGTATVTVTPSGGFAGTVALMCGTGGTFIPAGYTCSFGQASLPVNNATATTPLNLTPISTATGAVKQARRFGLADGLWGASFGAGLLLLGIFGFGRSGARSDRNFFVACGLLMCVANLVLACGGGGGGGGGPVSTTTTISSTNLHVGFGTPVTFTVTVTPHGSATPTGLVQLYDNGQPYGSPAKVSAGIATFLSTSLPVGVHNFTANYLGDANTQASSSAPIVQVITGSVGLQISGSADGITETADFTVMVN
jgi:large repetitive protein